MHVIVILARGPRFALKTKLQDGREVIFCKDLSLKCQCMTACAHKCH